ncbi:MULTISPECIES: hypothetical protein [Halorussus]|uniref:hypothetical protein n=1 Tax=Halorussus TaxID=1070314 RepID=UPI00209EAF9E|nr:hypothetical protein [Halorussus vallis]USZ74044.1 hypothetical protein NGM07_11310 [Halorussus vallis]
MPYNPQESDVGEWWPWTDANGRVKTINALKRVYPKYGRGYDEFADPLPRD